MNSSSVVLLALAMAAIFTSANCKATENLPPDVVSSANFLFDVVGLPDPRGCEYRDFESQIKGPGYTNAIEARGWIIPARQDQKERFAIGWNGGIYPVTKMGPKADLKEDVQALLRIEKRTLTEVGTNQFFGWPIWNEALGEPYSVSETNPTVLKVLFLERLDETKLAGEYWDGWRAVNTMNEMPQGKADHFYEFAYAWSATVFEQAVSSHMNGDDNLAVTELRALTRIRPELEREAARRGFTRPLGMDSTGHTMPISYFSFLDRVPALLADEERRINEAPHESALQIGLDKFPDKSKRIAALISDLDQISLYSFMDQFNGESLNLHPTVLALVDQSNDAVEPLIECMEHDQRLTRSVHFAQSMDEIVQIVSVADAAQEALDGILKMHFDTAAEYQDYWQKYKSLAQAERWYDALRDDHAGRKQWMEAAENILSRTDGKYTYSWREAPAPNASNGLTYVVKDLRLKSNPSISDLLAKRALAIAPTNYDDSDACWSFDDATTLTMMLVELVPDNAPGVLTKLIPRCPLFFGWDEADVQEDLAKLAVALAHLGDGSGLDIYAKWLACQKFNEVQDGWALPKVLAPLGRFPDRPSIREVSAKIFQIGTVDWLNQPGGSDDLLQTHLIRNEAFRDLVLQSLKNGEQCGTIVIKEGGQFEATEGQGGFGGDVRHDDPLAPKIGQRISFRVCDDTARRLSRIKNLPQFEPYWPEDKRNTAIAAISVFLKEHGNHLEVKPPSWPLDTTDDD